MFWSCWDCLGAFGIVWELLGLYRVCFWDCLGAFGIVWDCRSIMKIAKIIKSVMAITELKKDSKKEM